MAGHSKWAQIKRQKAANDKARGKLFAKLAREISVAAREGGGDAEFNPRLRTAIDNAKAQNMPADNIERAILRGTGQLPGASYEPVTYEGYGPGGVAFLLECLTDNQNRTVAELRHLLDSRGGNLGSQGSVAWMFERVGRILVDASRCGEEDALEAALESGADDMQVEDGVYAITTRPTEFHAVQEALRARGLPLEEAELALVPSSTMNVSGREAERLLALLEALEEHDDVQKVWSNLEIEESELSSLAEAG